MRLAARHGQVRVLQRHPGGRHRAARPPRGPAAPPRVRAGARPRRASRARSATPTTCTRRTTGSPARPGCWTGSRRSGNRRCARWAESTTRSACRAAGGGARRVSRDDAPRGQRHRDHERDRPRRADGLLLRAPLGHPGVLRPPGGRRARDALRPHRLRPRRLPGGAQGHPPPLRGRAGAAVLLGLRELRGRPREVGGGHHRAVHHPQPERLPLPAHARHPQRGRPLRDRVEGRRGLHASGASRRTPSTWWAGAGSTSRTASRSRTCAR